MKRSGFRETASRMVVRGVGVGVGVRCWSKGANFLLQDEQVRRS